MYTFTQASLYFYEYSIVNYRTGGDCIHRIMTSYMRAHTDTTDYYNPLHMR